jgi:peptide/nickel transport system substrate-binding protein
VFSNGKPVVASDFTYAVERAIKMPWGGSGAFITPVIAGATAYSNGKANTITGIQTNNKTGKIVIHLTSAYGPFENVLAFPSLGLVYPPDAPFTNEPTNPPPGVGPYNLTNIVPNASFEAVPNPRWASFHIPGIPSGHVRVIVKVNQTNVAASAESVLNNTADVFDWADTIPGALLPQIQAHASSRYHLEDLGGSSYFIFMNSQEKPFSSQLAREAVITALDEGAMNRLGSGTLKPGCFFLPKAVPGHPSGGKCPYANSSFSGNIAKAKRLVQQSGMAGTDVTVWGQTRTPRQQWMTYYTQVLNQIGFHATQKVIADHVYFTTIGNLSLHPQTGFGDWNMDYPHPIDFYSVLLTKQAILPSNNENWGEVQDPFVDSQVVKLQGLPLTPAVVAKWQALDTYVAKKAYIDVFGYQTFPFFTSSRINWKTLVISPLYGWDWSSFTLK